MSKAIRLAPGSSNTNLIIPLGEPECGISGRILHDDQTPVTRFVIDINSTELGDPFSLSRSFSDRLGRFVILDLPAGEFEMQTMPADRTLLAPPELLSIQLRKGMVYSDVVVVVKEPPGPEDLN